MLVDAQTAGISPSEALLASLADHLQSRGTDWFGTEGPVHVDYLRMQARRNATLYYFATECGGKNHTIVVKVPFGRRHSGKGLRNAQKTLPNELRILPISTSGDRGPLEYTTLSRIDETFGAGGDKRFGAIHILDYLPEAEALVMEYSPDDNLDDLFARRSRLHRHRQSSRVDRPISHAGAWLRRYHELPPFPETTDRTSLREDFLASIDRFTDYLLDTGSKRPLIERTRAAIHRSAGASLPENLPLAINHGDFVPRNVLVAESGRVTVFDTRAQWRAPIYEDISRFLVALSASELQMLGLGLMYDSDELAEYESAFLQGYFGENETPIRAIKCFEAQRLLAIWVASAYQNTIGKGLRGARKRLMLELRGRHLQRRLHKVVETLDSHG